MQIMSGITAERSDGRFGSFAIPRSVKILLGTMAAVFAGLWLIFHGRYNLVAGIIYLSLFFLIVYWNKPLSLVVVPAFAFLLGDLRRIMDFTGEIPTFDPLLLVSPIFSLIMVAPILMDLKLRDPVQKAMLGLMVIMTLEIFNPIQGPLIVGFGGAMTYLIPICWFWLGWRYGSLQLLRRLIALLVALGVIAAMMGIIQTYIGYLPWQQAWLDKVGSHIHSMYLGAGVLRAVGFSVNGVEFMGLLSMSLVASMALFIAGKRPYLLLVPLIAFGLFLSSSRTSILLSVFGMAIAWTVSSRNSRVWVPRLIFALVIGLGALIFSVTHAASSEDTGGDSKDNTAAGLSTQHQVQGLAHPFDSKHSTANLHGQMLLGGLLDGFRNPIGRGLGSTFATAKLGGDSSSAGSSEIDISDMFLTTGLIGGLLYIFIIVVVAKRASYLIQNVPQNIALPIAGILACTLGGWLMAGKYGENTWLWLVIGIVCRFGSVTVPMKSATPSQAI
ncbi:MAG: hypothetical protein PW789_19875 [Edaphobacter sp.]|uniref:hypothetical protein n=1 Tax=Edaphobacter sp. TaxID=1934404 RepID=UPI002385AAAD|nr:hypothetical protein [Edaphobacter sp.]MDE1178840.1 hypothetical protein [Edaphobacter sp.]